MEEITLSPEKKRRILKNTEDLLQLYHDGSLGGEIMPEDANPGLEKDTKENYLYFTLGQFTRNYTQTVKRAADNKRRYAPGWVHSTCLLRGFPKGAAPHLAHDFAEQSVVCYTLCRRCPENTVAAGEGKGI